MHVVEVNNKTEYMGICREITDYLAEMYNFTYVYCTKPCNNVNHVCTKRFPLTVGYFFDLLITRKDAKILKEDLREHLMKLGN